MLKYSKNSVTSYLDELTKVDFKNFNKFILTKILANAIKFHTILPIMIAMGVVAFSLALQDGFYIFIPQSSITAFASYVIFACVASALVLVLYPLAIILVLNYIGNKIRSRIKHLFFPLKLFILVLAFYVCVTIMTHTSFNLNERLYITGLWTLFYFFLVNIYLSYTSNNGAIKFSKIRTVFALIFIALLIKPFLIMFVFTSQMINYTSVNANLYLSQTNCKLITTPIGDEDRSKNMAINDQRLYKAVDGGCYIYSNSIRYGFGGDYVLIFKKNIDPIVNSNKQKYNSYVRLTCYAGNCYAQDNILTLSNEDSQSALIAQDQARKARRIKRMD